VRGSLPPRQLAAILVGYLAGGALYPYLPRAVAYLDIAGLDIGRGMIAFLLPTMALLTTLLMGSLWRRDPLRVHDPQLQTTYEAVVFRCVLFVLSVQFVVVAGLLERAGVLPQAVRPVVSRVMPVLLGLALIAIGNILPRMRRNVVIGIRTRRTLADAGEWDRTNRMAGYVAVALGASFCLAGVLVPPGTARAQVMSAAALAAMWMLVRNSRARVHV
jgi:uncharacterized membrane protein